MRKNKIYRNHNALAGTEVNEAMQRIVHYLPETADIAQCVRMLIRINNSCILVTRPGGYPDGVVSKKDIVNAYYKGLPLETRILDIMTGPLLFCKSGDLIEDVATKIADRINDRILVYDQDESDIEGTLEYSDITNLLYRYCRLCEKSRWHGPGELKEKPFSLMVKEAMVEDAPACGINHSIFQVIELLSGTGYGATLVYDENLIPCGVISITDLIIAYIHNISPEMPAGKIMSAPVACCNPYDMLKDAVQKMFVKEILQLYVKCPSRESVGGQLTLSHAAKYRSGTCGHCINSIIQKSEKTVFGFKNKQNSS